MTILLLTLRILALAGNRGICHNLPPEIKRNKRFVADISIDLVFVIRFLLVQTFEAQALRAALLIYLITLAVLLDALRLGTFAPKQILRVLFLIASFLLF